MPIPTPKPIPVLFPNIYTPVLEVDPPEDPKRLVLLLRSKRLPPLVFSLTVPSTFNPNKPSLPPKTALP
jgi:hypothetical protein